MLRAEYLQELRVHENEVNCEQLKSEMEKLARQRARETERKEDTDKRASRHSIET